MKVHELESGAGFRGKFAQPHKVSTHEHKTFVVNPATFEESYLRIVRTDALIQELLQRGQFRKAQPTLTYGSFEVEPEFAETFQKIAGECGLSVVEE